MKKQQQGEGGGGGGGSHRHSDSVIISRSLSCRKLPAVPACSQQLSPSLSLSKTHQHSLALCLSSLTADRQTDGRPHGHCSFWQNDQRKSNSDVRSEAANSSQPKTFYGGEIKKKWRKKTKENNVLTIPVLRSVPLTLPAAGAQERHGWKKERSTSRSAASFGPTRFLPFIFFLVFSSAIGSLYSIPLFPSSLLSSSHVGSPPRSVSSSLVRCHTNCAGFCCCCCCCWSHSCRSHLARSAFALLIYYFLYSDDSFSSSPQPAWHCWMISRVL